MVVVVLVVVVVVVVVVVDGEEEAVVVVAAVAVGFFWSLLSPLLPVGTTTHLVHVEAIILFVSPISN